MGRIKLGDYTFNLLLNLCERRHKLLYGKAECRPEAGETVADLDGKIAALISAALTR